MNTTDTRPFDHDAALAGAPYACANGQSAWITDWNARAQRYTLTGSCGDAGQASSWTRLGRHCSGLDLVGEYSELDLVMTPLGYLDGKPVFDGDLLVDTRGARRLAHAGLTIPGSWKWPALRPAPAAGSASGAVLTITADQAGGIAKHVVGQQEWPDHIKQRSAAAPAPAAAEDGRAARDMAVAVAVVYALRAASDSQPAAVWQAVTREHLASIIARVPS